MKKIFSFALFFFLASGLFSAPYAFAADISLRFSANSVKAGESVGFTITGLDKLSGILGGTYCVVPVSSIGNCDGVGNASGISSDPAPSVVTGQLKIPANTAPTSSGLYYVLVIGADGTVTKSGTSLPPLKIESGTSNNGGGEGSINGCAIGSNPPQVGGNSGTKDKACIEYAESLLTAKGVGVEEDGVYSATDLQTVKQWQADNSDSINCADGIIGGEMWSYLLGKPKGTYKSSNPACDKPIDGTGEKSPGKKGDWNCPEGAFIHPETGDGEDKCVKSISFNSDGTCSGDKKTKDGLCLKYVGSNPNSTGGGSNLDCSAQGLESVNGLCLPPKTFNGKGLVACGTLGACGKTIVNMFLTLSGIFAVIFILVGGFQYITSSGNEEQATKGRKTLTYALIGLVVAVLAYTLVNIVFNTIINGPLG